MDIDLGAAARGKTDEELVAMVEREHRDFTPEALDAARAELGARGVSWVEPDPQSVDVVSQAPSRAQRAMSVVGAIFVVLAVVGILRNGASLPSLALLIPGAALLLRSMNTP